MAEPLFSPEQLAAIESMIAAAISAANIPAIISTKLNVPATFIPPAFISSTDIPFFYPDMPSSWGYKDAVINNGQTYYRSVSAFTSHLREIVTEKNARTIRENVSFHLQ